MTDCKCSWLGGKNNSVSRWVHTGSVLMKRGKKKIVGSYNKISGLGPC